MLKRLLSLPRLKTPVVIGMGITVGLMLVSLCACDLVNSFLVKESPGGFAMRSDGGSGIMNCRGEWVLGPLSYESGLVSGNMVEGWAPIMNVTGATYNYINAKGELLSDQSFEMAMPFSEGLAAVRVDGLWGFIDTSGKMAIRPQFLSNYIGSFSGGLANVVVESTELGVPSSWVFIDQKGETVLGPYNGAGTFSNGYASASLINDDHTLRSGFIDPKGDFVLVFTEDDDFRPNGPYAEGLFPVVDTKKQLNEGTCSRGFMDKDANWVIPPQYCQLGVFSDGLAPVSRSMEHPMLWGYINSGGESVIPESYAQADPFSGGCARVFWDNYNGIGLIDTRGEFIYKYESESN